MEISGTTHADIIIINVYTIVDTTTIITIILPESLLAVSYLISCLLIAIINKRVMMLETTTMIITETELNIFNDNVTKEKKYVYRSTCTN